MLSREQVQTHAQTHLRVRLKDAAAGTVETIFTNSQWRPYIDGIHYNVMMLEKEGWCKSIKEAYRFIEDASRKFADVHLQNGYTESLYAECVRDREKLANLKKAEKLIQEQVQAQKDKENARKKKRDLPTSSQIGPI